MVGEVPLVRLVGACFLFVAHCSNDGHEEWVIEGSNGKVRRQAEHNNQPTEQSCSHAPFERNAAFSDCKLGLLVGALAVLACKTGEAGLDVSLNDNRCFRTLEQVFSKTGGARTRSIGFTPCVLVVAMLTFPPGKRKKTMDGWWRLPSSPAPH